MEEELRCPTCKQLFANPVLLPCFHALCLGCALDIQTAYTPASALAAVNVSAAALVSNGNINGGGGGGGGGCLVHSHPLHGSTASHGNSITTTATVHAHGGVGASASVPTPQPPSSHPPSTRHSSNSSAASTASSATGSESVTSDQDQADKVSILSEADSGVVCCSNTSRPVSYAGTAQLQGLLQGAAAAAPPGAAFYLTCPLCRKLVFFDEGGVRNLPAYRTMESIVDRFCAREALRCQMCETDPKVASIVCEQCEIRYCDACRELCHPARGPLAKHNLVKPRNAASQRESVCGEHEDTLSMYCLVCKMPACPQCIAEKQHPGHEVQSISVTCKAQKTELSHNLQQLSEKARSTTEFIQRLKGMSDKVTESCMEFERLVTAQCEALIQAIHDRREYLLEAIRMDKDTKIRILKDQQSNCTGKLQQTTGLIQFCIEALKETDSAAFLQVGSMLINRVANTDMTWHQEVTNAAPRVSPIVDLTLDDAALVRAIDNLNFMQMKAVKDEEERLPAGEMLLPLATATATTATIKINKHLTSKTKTIIPTTAIATTTTTTSTRTSTNINNATTITTNLKRTATLPKSISSRFLNIPIYNNTHLTVHNNANNNNIFRNKTYSNMNTNNINTINSSSPSPSPSLSSTTTTTITSTTSSPSLSPTLSLPSLSLLSTTLFSTLTTKTPLAPTIVPEDCSAENNSVTVAWHAPAHSFVDGYVLELDDGSGGEFREVYCGKETICTVDGLHFNSMYNARVKAFNNAGEGEYSELIGLQTAEVAWFTFDPILSGGAGSGLVFSNNNATVSVEGWEHRVALGSVGFSRGIHYWEFTVDKYTMDTDPAFGVARIDVNRNKMLGKDEKSFAMYIDGQRSWFQHNSVHERRVEGGITTGSTIGVLLDLERHTLSFLVNEMPQGSVAFRDLYGVFYPAVSINRGVTLTLHTALVAPKMDYF